MQISETFQASFSNKYSSHNYQLKFVRVNQHKENLGFSTFFQWKVDIMFNRA